MPYKKSLNQIYHVKAGHINSQLRRIKLNKLHSSRCNGVTLETTSVGAVAVVLPKSMKEASTRQLSSLPRPRLIMLAVQRHPMMVVARLTIK